MEHLPRIALGVVCLGLAACAASVPLNRTEVEEQVSEQAGKLVPGETDRATVRARLGEPWLIAEDWRVDVFRTSGSDVKLPILFVLWWPVPVGVSVDKSTVYVLVRYDERDVVTDARHAVATDPSFFNEDYSRTDSDAMIQLDPLRFSAGAGGKAGLLSLDREAAHAYLQARPPGSNCRVFLGCTSWQLACAARVTVDGKQVPPLVGDAADFERVESFHGALIPIEVEPGTHDLRLTPVSGRVEYEAVARFTCRAGETKYALLDLQPHEERGFLTVRLLGSLVVSDTIPEPFVERRLVVWHDGRWLVH